jgi:UDP-glucose 4-epimerase
LPDQEIDVNAQPPTRVAVTGGAGFVGLNIVEALLTAGHHVVVLDRAVDAHAQSVFEAAIDRVAVVPLDVTDSAALERALVDNGVTDAIHAAAITNAPGRITLPMLDVNLRATQVLLDLAATLPLRRLVIVSSAAVFRQPSGPPLPEDAPITMEHPYGILKAAAERLVTYARHADGVDAYTVRLGNVYGPHERPTGSRVNMSTVHHAVALALAGQPIVATAPDLGRDWTHAADVGDGVARLLAHPHPQHDLYHLAVGRDFSLAETLAAVATAIPDTRVTWVDQAEQANIPLSIANRRPALGIDRARADFGFAPRYDIQTGIAAYVDSMRS